MAITPNLANFQAPTSVGGIKLPTASTTPAKKKYTDSLATLNVGSNPAGLQQTGITNQQLLPEHLRTGSSNGATSPTPTKIIPPTSTPNTGSMKGAAGAYYGQTIDTKGDVAAQIAAIDRQRAGGGTGVNSTAGQAFIGSTTNVDGRGRVDDLTDRAPGTLPPTPPSPLGTGGGTTAPGAPTGTGPAQPSTYDLAMKSYLESLKSSQDITARVQKQTMEANHGYQAEKDRDGGYQSGNDLSAARRARMDNASLADLGIAETAATNQANLAFQRLNFEKANLPNQDPYTLSPGQTRYDSKGNVISALPEGASDQPTSVQEYQFAKDNGYTGTYEQFKNSGGSGDSGRVLSASEAQSLGVPFGTTASQAYGITPQKPLTEAQAKDVTYGQRGGEANDIINDMQDTIANFNPATYAAYAALEPGSIGNALVPDSIRQIRQAERNFATAILRRESGAAISSGEFSTVEKQYFPRPGDDAQTLQQKAQNRQTAINSFLANVPTAAGGGSGSSGSGGLWDF